MTSNVPGVGQGWMGKKRPGMGGECPGLLIQGGAEEEERDEGLIG